MRSRARAARAAMGAAVCAAAVGAAVLAAPLVPYGDAAAFAGAFFFSPRTAVDAAGSCLAAPRAQAGAAAAGTGVWGGAARDAADADWAQLPADSSAAAAPNGTGNTGSAAGAAGRTAVPAANGSGQTAGAAGQSGDTAGQSGDTAGSIAGESPAAAETPPADAAPIVSVHYEQGSGPYYIACGSGTIKNCTQLPAAEVAAEVGQPLPFQIEKNGGEPQVLIMHTHATETYELTDRTWCDPDFSARSMDTAVNMVAVGARIAAALNAAGIRTVHDEALHDYPSYTGSYAASNAAVRQYLKKYPGIRVVLDVHRDAIQKEDGTRVKPVAEIGGRQAAQVMIICGADENGNLPNCRQNLRFAARWEAAMEDMYPGLTRPVLFDYRHYNQDLTTGSLLIEVGGHANTLAEALYSGDLVGRALAALLAGG